MSVRGPIATNFSLGPDVSFRRKAEDLLEGDAQDRVVNSEWERATVLPRSPGDKLLLLLAFA